MGFTVLGIRTSWKELEWFEAETEVKSLLSARNAVQATPPLRRASSFVMSMGSESCVRNLKEDVVHKSGISGKVISGKVACNEVA
jgi:hypothetical protein